MSAPDLLARVHRVARERGARCGVRFLGFDTPDVEIPYERLLRMSAWLARRIPIGEVPPTVLIATNGAMPALLAWFAALDAGVPPLVLPGPRALGGVDRFTQRMRHLVGRFEGRCVLALEDGLVPDGALALDVPVLPLPSAATGYGTAEPRERRPPVPGEMAFLQATSASTGDGKLVAISHANACANLDAMRASLGAGPDSRMCSWLPLYHDMGLVGTALLSIYQGWPLYIMKPTEFIMRPHRWVEAMSRFRCTITAAPNFGYDLARRMVTAEQAGEYDLSSVERAVVGAEPIGLSTMDGFFERFRGAGLRADSLVPSYGMAESTLATTMVRRGNLPRYVLVDTSGTAPGKPVRILGEGLVGDSTPAPGGDRGVAVFSVGPPLDGIELSLVDDDGYPVDEPGVLGEVTLRGPSVCLGYYDYATGRPAPHPAGELRTGDLGFVLDGELFILDRKKHVIIRHGQNHLASLLEERIASVLGGSARDLVMFDADIRDAASDICVVVENWTGGDALRPDQVAALRDLDLPVDVLLFSRKRVIARTTSGKKQYDQMRQRVARGDLPVSSVTRLAPARLAPQP